ncbi:MAG: hypothetical protein AAB447_01960 [Patescibacteria group bacterium]
MGVHAMPEIKAEYPHLVHYNSPEEVARIQQSIDESERQLFEAEEAEGARQALIPPRPVPDGEIEDIIWKAGQSTKR